MNFVHHRNVRLVSQADIWLWESHRSLNVSGAQHAHIDHMELRRVSLLWLLVWVIWVGVYVKLFTVMETSCHFFINREKEAFFMFVCVCRGGRSQFLLDTFSFLNLSLFPVPLPCFSFGFSSFRSLTIFHPAHNKNRAFHMVWNVIPSLLHPQQHFERT